MNLGANIKRARRQAGLSLRELSRRVGVSAQAISKYERGVDVPGSAVLIRLAQALDLTVARLLRPDRLVLSPATFRRRAALGAREQEAIIAEVHDWLERYLAVEEIVGGGVPFTFPLVQRRVTSLDEVERVALDLRGVWELGLDPIENLVEVLEAHGIKVGLVEGPETFDALTLWADSNIPVIAVRRVTEGDRQRFNLAHELGRLLLEPVPEVDEEKMAHRFAGAFLVPKPVVVFELGNHRSRLDLFELHLLKHRYGVSMRAWIHRAVDVGILPEASAKKLLASSGRIRRHGKEPGDSLESERSDRLERLVLRALAEELISESRAVELLGMPLGDYLRKAVGRHGEISVLGYR